MTFLTENAEHILAMLGGAYVLVRAIVAATPTQRDDEMLARATPFLKSVAALFGLDPKQGRQAPPPPTAE